MIMGDKWTGLYSKGALPLSFGISPIVARGAIAAAELSDESGGVVGWRRDGNGEANGELGAAF